MVEFTVPADEVYDGDEIPQFVFEKYQKGFLGILNNAYNQSCNNGNNKKLGPMSLIRASFVEDVGSGSYAEFVDYYNEHWGGEKRVYEASMAMAKNIVSRVESVDGSIEFEDALLWAHDYIQYMLVNSYKGFCSEEAAIRTVAGRMQTLWSVTDSMDEESAGIDGYVGGRSVQVKPMSYQQHLDVNEGEAEAVIEYGLDDGTFTFRYEVVA